MAATRCLSARSEPAAPSICHFHPRRPAPTIAQSQPRIAIRPRAFSSESKAGERARKKNGASHGYSTRKTFAGLSAFILLVLLAQSPSGKLYLESLYTDGKQPRQSGPELLDLETTIPSSSYKTAPDAPGQIPISEAHLHPIPPETFTYVDPRPFKHMPFGDLLSRYAVFTMCCFPSLVERAPALLDWALEGTSLPGVKSLTEWVIKKTFFKQVSGLLFC